jgi:prepilin-type N-terminal cleavage/methylation domain-containing protein
MKYLKHITHKGFSLVELIIVIAIFLVITMVVVFNQNRFSSDISISNISYQIALQIRQAQVFGTLVRDSGVEQSVPTDFDLGYGVNFFKNTDSSIGFSIFADADSDVPAGDIYGNGKYEDESEDVNISTFNLSEGNAITEVCVFPNAETDGGSCMDSAGGSGQVDIVFRRPEPDAIISSDDIAGAQRAEIIVTSALRDRQKKITVRNTGQISVTNVEQAEVQ